MHNSPDHREAVKRKTTERKRRLSIISLHVLLKWSKQQPRTTLLGLKYLKYNMDAVKCDSDILDVCTGVQEKNSRSVSATEEKHMLVTLRHTFITRCLEKLRTC